MEVGVVGINHQTAPVAILERVSLSEPRKIEAMLHLLDGEVSETVILNTCGRFEVYFSAPKARFEAALAQVTALLGDLAKMADIGDFSYVHRGAGALSHMVEVAVGLDSIVLGEDQIIGQMKSAHHVAKELGCTGRILNVVFRDAIASAKRIKTELKISEIPLSLSYVGVKEMEGAFGSLRGKRILVVGLGEMGLLAIQHAHTLGAKLLVTNRSKEKVDGICTSYDGVTGVDYEARFSAIAACDGVITATSAPHMVFTREDFDQWKNPARPMVILDLSMPKDVDDRVGEMADVTLINLDFLARAVAQNRAQREALVALARDRVKDHVVKMVQWLDRSRVHATLKDLNALVGQSHEDAMGYINEKLSLDRHEKAIVDKAMMAALKRLVRGPVHQLNALETEEDRAQATYWLARLFGEDL